MVAIGNGATSQVESQIAALGQNVVLVFSGSVTTGGVRAGWGNAGTLKIGDAQAIMREVPDAVAVSPEVRTQNQVGAENQNWFTNIQGESPDYFSIRNWQFAEGTSFSDQDVRSANKVAVIGKTIARQLFERRRSARARFCGSRACRSRLSACWRPRASRSWGRTRTTW